MNPSVDRFCLLPFFVRFLRVFFCMLLFAVALFSTPARERPAAAAPANYYVAPTGSDADNNPCTDPHTPCRTITAAIVQPLSNAVATVWVASGSYMENIVMRSGVSVIGSDPRTTFIIGAASVNGVVNFDSVSNATLKGFTITVSEPKPGTDRAIVVYSSGPTAVIENNVLINTQYGMFVGSGPTIRNNVIIGDGHDEDGIYIASNTISPILTNNIITGFSTGIYLTPITTAPVTKYNDLWNNTTNYRNMADQTGVNGNISVGPQFMNPAAGDYRLGCLSPLIDAGDPTFAYALEPAPNGGRIDIGAYGNTPAATSFHCPVFIPAVVR